MAERTTTVDPAKLDEFLGRVVGDLGAALSAALVYIGQELGLYRALARGPLTPADLARETGTHERYIREWLVNQAAGGYVQLDAATNLYSLTPEQAVALTDESSPAFVGGGFHVVKALAQAAPRIRDAFRSGAGMPWGEHDPDLFLGTERFFRPGYAAHLTAEWIPALTGIRERLESGGRIADVGCGHGASTILMARAYPKATVVGTDLHPASIERARAAARDAGLADRVRFEVADAAAFQGDGYDLIAFFDCLHDMVDPVAALRRARQTLAAGGSVLIVEPMAGEHAHENLNPIGRTFAAASTLCCVPNSIAGGGPALGALAPESALRRVVEEAGFTKFRRATETPFNRVYEARA